MQNEYNTHADINANANELPCYGMSDDFQLEPSNFIFHCFFPVLFSSSNKIEMEKELKSIENQNDEKEKQQHFGKENDTR